LAEEPAQEESTAQASTWNFTVLTAGLVLGLIGQMAYLPCLCAIGVAKLTFALVFDGLILIRILLARHRKERNSGWVFYTILCLSSPAWIEFLSRLIVNDH